MFGGWSHQKGKACLEMNGLQRIQEIQVCKLWGLASCNLPLSAADSSPLEGERGEMMVIFKDEESFCLSLVEPVHLIY